MKQEGKRRNKFALLLVTENKEGTIRQHHVSSAIVQIVAAFLVLIIVAVTYKFIYAEIELKNARAKIMVQMAEINDLNDENEALTVENGYLSSKMNDLSEAVSQKTADEDAVSQKTIENALPKGFPISGPATMKEAEGEEPMLLFTASLGENIITTGTGTVISVEEDADYGNRIVIDHGNSYCSVYRNSGTLLVKMGEQLGKGYILFSVGKENQTLGYQIIKNDEYIDPALLMEVIN